MDTLADAFADALPSLLDMREPELLSAPGAVARVYRVERPLALDPGRREPSIIKVFGLGADAALNEKLYEKERARVAELVAILNDPQTPSCEQLARFERVHQLAWQGRALFIMEGVYYPSGDLARWRRGRARLSLELFERLIDAVVAGLSFLHERCRWVHHDLKPGNVFLEEGPEGLRALIGDFGAALPQDRTVTINQQLTYLYAPSNPAEEFGQPAYDVFSLACLTSFLIRGRFAAEDRRYGRLDAGAIAAAASEGPIAGADRAWYRELGGLLRDATGPAASRCGLAAFGRRLKRAGARCRRRARIRAGLRRRQDALAVSGAALLFVVGLALAWGGRAMPAEARAVSGYRLAAGDGRLRLALPEAPSRVAYELAIPGPCLGAARPLEDGAWTGDFLAWGARWLLSYEPEGARLITMGEDGALRDQSGRALIPAWAPGEKKGAAFGLAPWSDGLLRWRGRRLEAWGREAGGRFIKLGEAELSADLVGIDGELGGPLRGRDAAGAASALDPPFFEGQADPGQ